MIRGWATVDFLYGPPYLKNLCLIGYLGSGFKGTEE
jgi:hypothetical protein